MIVRDIFYILKWLVLANWPWKFRLSLVQLHERKILELNLKETLVLWLHDFISQVGGCFVWRQLTELGTKGLTECKLGCA